MQPGRLLKKRYRLRKLVESDIGSDTWVARDEVLDREVFVKLLKLEVAASAEGQKRFSREIGNMANLSHPNIMATYDTIQDYAATGAVREKVRGKPLTHFLRARGALPPIESIGMATQVVDALTAAHEHGIFHQNLRPESVWVCVDRVIKVTDFGSVWRLGSSGAVLPGVYSDPRLPAEAEADEPAEVYALGKLLAACLDASSRDAVLLGLSTEETKLPDDFLIFLAAACAEDRSHRPTLGQVKTSLLSAGKQLESKSKTATPAAKPQALQSTAASRPEPPGPEEWQRKRSRVRWWLIVLGIVALAAGIVVSLLSSGNNLPERTIRSPENSAPIGTLTTSSTTYETGSNTTDKTEDSEEAAPPEEVTNSGGEGLISVVYATTFAEDAPSGQLGTEPEAVYDGDASTYWETPGIIAGNLTVGGVGLVMKLNQAIPLQEVLVRSPTSGWSAEIYAAEAAFPQRSDWGNIVDGRRIENGEAIFKMGGTNANSILLWIDEPAAALTNQIRISEIAVVPAEE